MFDTHFATRTLIIIVNHQRQFFPGELVSMRTLAVAMRWECDTKQYWCTLHNSHFNKRRHYWKTDSLPKYMWVTFFFIIKNNTSWQIFVLFRQDEHFIQKMFRQLNQNFRLRKDKNIVITYWVTACAYQYTSAHHRFVWCFQKFCDKFRFRVAKNWIDHHYIAK